MKLRAPGRRTVAGAIAAGVAVCALAGCGDGAGGGSDDVVTSVVRVIDAENEIYHRLCECHDAFGRPDETSCFKTFVARDAAQETCVRELFAANAIALAETVACLFAAIDDAHGCLDAVTACESAAVLGCAVEGRAAADACGAFPDDVTAGLAECYR